MPQTLRDVILQMNARMSDLFISTTPARRAHRAKHPTEWAVTMCMDGRVNMRGATGLPFGLITPFRNLGGRYDPRWPKMRDSMLEFYEYAYSQHVYAGMIITYHWSGSHTHLGCRGFENNLEQAIQFMFEFRAQVLRSFPGMIWPIVVGLDTDTNAMIVHGERGSKIDIKSTSDPSEQYFAWQLRQMFDDYPEGVLHDLVPFLVGNANYLSSSHANGGRSSEVLQHAERGIAFGQGFDWIDQENLLLIVGPCDPALDDAIVTAASIVQENNRSGEGAQRGIFLVSTPYRKPWERPSAAEHSLYMASFGLASIRDRLPDMADYFVPLVGTLDLGTRRFEVIRFDN